MKSKTDEKCEIQISQSAILPTKFGFFRLQAFKEGVKEHLCVMNGDFKGVVNVRIHSECLTGDTLHSMKCDCGEQLAFALRYISKNGGLLIYLRQEGRGIGLFNKINAYALQDKGLDTLQANLELGFKGDERDYGIVKYILNHYKIREIALLTNNPAKLASIDFVSVKRRIPIVIKANAHNKDYLGVKRNKMGHLL